MKTQAIAPAELVFDHPDHPGTPYCPAFGDVYHARAGAFAQAEHVFLAGNQLPARWRGRERFVVLETGFGLGNNFLATWAAWRADAQRPRQLVFIAIEKHPLRQPDLARAHAHSTAPDLAQALLAAWPALTPDIHTLDFDAGQVKLLLAWGDVALWLPELVASVDAFFLDGFAPARNAAMWAPEVFKSLARLAAPGATAATWSVAREVRDGLSSAGFAVQRVAGFGSKRHMLVAHWPANRPDHHRLAPPGRQCADRARSALVVGAGLAGAAAARALAAQGLTVTVLERRLAAAQETSGNPAGLFHGVLHPHDGAHAQLLRAAALRGQQLLRPLVEQHGLPGAVRGLLRTDPTAPEAAGLLAQQGLPADYVQALSAGDASALAGLALPHAAWLYPGGGWISPPALVRHWLAQPGVTLRPQADVATLHPSAGGWQALDAQGQVLAQADVVVLACAQQTMPLLAGHTDCGHWPLRRNRGQITQLPPGAPLPRPALPLASGGYLISLPDSLGGGLLCGATQQPDDDDPALRSADHQHNLDRVAALTGQTHRWSAAELVQLSGRVGWRLSCTDRLPLLGPVPVGPAARAGSKRLEQTRQVPRIAGLYLLTALGSRGLTLAPLLGEVLAAWVTGAPLPLAASLLDAVDVGRCVSRLARRPDRGAMPHPAA